MFTSHPFTVAELSKAKTWPIKQVQVQAQAFPDTIEALKRGKVLLVSHSLCPLNPFLDADGLLQVCGGLSQTQYHLLIIPVTKHHLVSLIIQIEHKHLCHTGPKLTLGSLQCLSYLFGARKAVRKWTRQCIICQQCFLKVSTHDGSTPSSLCSPNVC